MNYLTVLLILLNILFKYPVLDLGSSKIPHLLILFVIIILVKVVSIVLEKWVGFNMMVNPFSGQRVLTLGEKPTLSYNGF